jgi:hypothetical protein
LPLGRFSHTILDILVSFDDDPGRSPVLYIECMIYSTLANRPR